MKLMRKQLTPIFTICILMMTALAACKTAGIATSTRNDRTDSSSANPNRCSSKNTGGLPGVRTDFSLHV